jgi:flagellar motor switch protein FliM
MSETAPRSDISPEEVSALLEKSSADGAQPYDFAAQRINKMQLPLLELVAKSFAERATVSLSSLLGRDANLQFTSLESAKSADLQAALPLPASIAVVKLKPLPGQSYICIEPSLLLTLLDGFFGGSGRAMADSQAVTAPAAQRFLGLMLRSFAADVATAWAPVTVLEMELVKQETNPRLVPFGAPLESLLVLKFTVEFAARSGTIDWLLPESLIAPVREALAADGGQTSVRKQEAWAPALTTALQEAQVDTRAILAQAQISLRELVRLAPGDVIPIEAPQQVTLYAGDVPLYQGRFGISQGRNALKILTGVSP